MRLIAIMLTVVTAGIVPGILSADDAPKRSPELQVLDRFVGTWDMKFTRKPAEGEKIALDVLYNDSNLPDANNSQGLSILNDSLIQPNSGFIETDGSMILMLVTQDI